MLEAEFLGKAVKQLPHILIYKVTNQSLHINPYCTENSAIKETVTSTGKCILLTLLS